MTEMTSAYPLLGRDHLSRMCREAGADDVGFVDVTHPHLDGMREGLLRAFPWAGTFMVLARRLNRHAVRTPLRSISSAAFTACAHDIKGILHDLERRLEAIGIRSVGISGFFPFELSRPDGSPFIAPLKILAEEAGLGIMGKNRLVLHPSFGANISLGAIVLESRIALTDAPALSNPCINCNLCAVTCPTGAISKDGHFDFGACMTHNYREKLGGFVNWVHTLADSRSRRDYRRRISDGETLSWWQSLGYEANTHCDYCVSVCPAGDETADYLANPKRFFRDYVRPLKERSEPVYVVKGSDAEAHVRRKFPGKRPRLIGRGLSASSIANFIDMLPHLFQRGQAKGLSACFHFRFRGREEAEATVEIHDQRISVGRGLTGSPNLTVIADSDAWLGFLAKDRSLVWELICRRVRLRGNPTLLLAFGRCFPS